ncbi:MAG: hypothetical protein CMM27_13620 [Rhodospirillaceae bacterium]|nr:hypothetical protein [Rhodospirillaceae bacterium]
MTNFAKFLFRTNPELKISFFNYALYFQRSANDGHTQKIKMTGRTVWYLISSIENHIRGKLWN